MIRSVVIIVVFAAIAAAQDDVNKTPQSTTPTQSHGSDLFGDALPRHAIARLGTTRYRHRGMLWDLRYSTNGKFLTAWSDDRFCVWDAQTGRQIRDENLRGLITLRIADDTMLLSNHKSKPFRPWYFTDAKSMPPPLPPERPATVEADMGEPFAPPLPDSRYNVVSPDRATVASFPYVDQKPPIEIELLQIESGKGLSEFKKLRSWRARFGINSMQFSNDGNRLVVLGYGDESRKVMLCHLHDDARVKLLSLPARSKHLTISPDGKRLAAIEESKLVVYDIASSEKIVKMAIPPIEREIKTIVWSPDGKRIAGGGTGSKIWIWDIQAGRPKKLADQTRWVQHLAFSPNGKSLASADGGIKVFDSETGLRKDKAAGHQAEIYDADLSPDGKLAVSCSYDGTARFWNASNGKQLAPTLYFHCNLAEFASRSNVTRCD